MTHDMKHLDHIRQVAEEDLAFVETKDRSYNGSWKRRGGVGAFMMLARKWDRLENMLGGSLNYDVFELICRETEIEREKATSQTPKGYDPVIKHGADGTALAEIRDLRRYLLLVEAEMISRGVLPRW